MTRSTHALFKIWNVRRRLKLRSRRKLAAGAVVAATVVGMHARAAHAECTPSSPCVGAPIHLGTLDESAAPREISFEAAGVNADGSVVVGKVVLNYHSDRTGFTTAYRAFRWTSDTGIVDLSTLWQFGADAVADAVNADGSVLVGAGSAKVVKSGASELGIHAFRWTSTGGRIDLGTLGGRDSEAHAVSADGSVTVGESGAGVEGSYGSIHAFRWTETGGMVDLGTLGPPNRSVARGVSADGLVVVGWSDRDVGAPVYEIHAFRWTPAGGMVDLGTLGGRKSDAYAVSADGSVIVGESRSTVGLLIVGESKFVDGFSHAFRWTAGGGMIDLGTLGGSQSRALGVSADGSVVVGWSETADGKTSAFRWTAANGMKNLNTLIADAGVNMTGIGLVAARAISGNGEFIVGDGYFSGQHRGFVLRYRTGPAPPK